MPQYDKYHYPELKVRIVRDERVCSRCSNLFTKGSEVLTRTPNRSIYFCQKCAWDIACQMGSESPRMKVVNV